MHTRQHECAALRRKLEAGVNIHMPAPRRIGKSWTVGRLATDLRADGWQVVEIDVQGITTPHEFASELCARIEAQGTFADRFKTHAVQRLRNLLGGNWSERLSDALGKVDPIEFAETLIASLADCTDKTAIIIDEISYFFLHLAEDSASDARDFAYKLRALPSRYGKVRWLITGSIGLDVMARRYGIEGAFVDFENFVLEPFTAEEARSYLRDPAIQQRFTHAFDATDEDFDAIFLELGWLAPYYLNLIANEVRPSLPGALGVRPIATRADLEAAFEKLLQPNRKSEFAIWREHITKNLPEPDRAIAASILGVLAGQSSGETEDTITRACRQFSPSLPGR